MRPIRIATSSNPELTAVRFGNLMDEPAIEKSERRLVGVRIQIVLLSKGSEPSTLELVR